MTYFHLSPLFCYPSGLLEGLDVSGLFDGLDVSGLFDGLDLYLSSSPERGYSYLIERLG